MAANTYSDDDDEIFIAASQQYERQQLFEQQDLELEENYGHMVDDDFGLDRLMEGVSEDGFQPSGAKNEPIIVENARFARPVTESDILDKIDGSIPTATRKSTTWAANTWREWADHRKKISSEFPPALDRINNKELNYWMARFVVEARNKKGDVYEGGTLYCLCCGVQRFIRTERRNAAVRGQLCDLDIFKDSSFEYFRTVLDSVLKDLRQSGVGLKKKRAEVITEDLEEKMWNENVLGDDTPEKLLHTLIFCFGLNFALRSGHEHRKLRPDMLSLKEPPNAIAYLLYTESGSKNRQGGLKERKVPNKVIKYFANDTNPSRCGIQLYKKYMSLRPSDAPPDVFYLKPLPEARPGCWYYNRPVGHNVLSQAIKKLCSEAGAEGYFTNHSLRRTCATRLFQKGIEEQQIMSITGHRSSNAVRQYKEISHEQEEKLSKLIQPVKKYKIDGGHSIEEPGESEESKNKVHTPVFNFNGCSVIFNNN